MTLAQKRFLFIILGSLAIFFITWLELFVQKKHYLIGGGLNRSFLFLLINVHVVIIVVLLYLIIRQSIKLFLERRKGEPGSVFKSNLLFTFTLFSIIPSFFVFFTAGKFITKSIDRWFQVHLDDGFKHAFLLHQQHTKHLRDMVAARGLELCALAAKKKNTFDAGQHFVDGRYSLYILNDDSSGLVGCLRDEIAVWRSFRIVNDRTTKSLAAQFFNNINDVEVSGGCFDFYGSLYWAKHVDSCMCLIAYRYPEPIRQSLITLENTATNYAHLHSMRNVIYQSYFFTFLVITLLIFFLSLWCAFYLAKGITKPIQELLEATEKVRRGRWDTQVQINPASDLQSLARGFNEMTRAVQLGQHHLAQKNKELLAILESLSTAVFLVNKFGRIIFCNAAAQKLVAVYVGPITFQGKKFTVFGSEIAAQATNFMHELMTCGHDHIAKELSLTFSAQPKTFMVYGRLFVFSPTAGHEPDGLLIMIEDLTELVKINKIKTWQEAAKQMAHEIKNPLTPIQLATQRLQRRFGAVLSNDPAFFDCTTTILNQVKVIKDLVTHFSVFASMPSPVIEVVDMGNLVREIICLYQLSYPSITFVFESDPLHVTIKTDKNKIRLVLINLLDNSVRILANYDGHANKQVTISLRVDEQASKVHLFFADNGPGIAQGVRDTLFLPYVSTEKKNMGLGLAIVRDTVVQLGGSITLDGVAIGAMFHIILPL